MRNTREFFLKKDCLNLTSEENCWDRGYDIKNDDMRECLKMNNRCSTCERTWNNYGGNTVSDSRFTENSNSNGSEMCRQWLLDKMGYAQAYVVPQESADNINTKNGIVCGSIFNDLIMPYRKPAMNTPLS